MVATTPSADRANRGRLARNGQEAPCHGGRSMSAGRGGGRGLAFVGGCAATKLGVCDRCEVREKGGEWSREAGGEKDGR